MQDGAWDGECARHEHHFHDSAASSSLLVHEQES
jgi:hypothetical protein